MRRPGKTERGTTIKSMVFRNGSDFFTTTKPSLLRVATFRYRFTSDIRVFIFEGLVPCETCANVYLKDVQFCCDGFHDALEENGSEHLPFKMSSTVTDLTVQSVESEMNLHIWHIL